jgi:hypothetical protein
MIIMGNPLLSLFGEGGKSCILVEGAGNVVNVGATLGVAPTRLIFLSIYAKMRSA